MLLPLLFIWCSNVCHLKVFQLPPCLPGVWEKLGKFIIINNLISIAPKLYQSRLGLSFHKRKKRTFLLPLSRHKDIFQNNSLRELLGFVFLQKTVMYSFSLWLIHSDPRHSLHRLEYNNKPFDYKASLIAFLLTRNLSKWWRQCP